MFCPHCNTWNDENYNYCYNCGTKLHVGNKVNNSKYGDSIDTAFVSSSNIAKPMKHSSKKKRTGSKKSGVFIAVWICAAVIIVIFSVQMGKMIAASTSRKVNRDNVVNAEQSKSTPASTIKIIEPASGYAEVIDDHYVLKIQVEPNSTVLINSNDFSDLVNADGTLEASVNLPSEGINDIYITVSAPNRSLVRQSVSIKRLPKTVADTAPDEENQTNNLSNQPQSEDEYIRKAWDIPYDQLTKYPRVYQNKIGLFLGEIEDLSVQNGISTFYLKLPSSDKLYIEYQGTLSSWKQGDDIKLYGEVDGTYDTLPRVKARYIYAQ